ncbi:MAG: hypothetical protein IAE95_06675 [Chitinophagaceae bacterium]|nr:hypothetical protein [Chitinophagaceae bacterium]
MKRIIASIVMIAYVAAAISFSFSFHYCGGELEDICFTADTEEGCCGSGEESSGCCEDKVVSAKYKDDHTPSVFEFRAFKILSEVVVNHTLPYIPSVAHLFMSGEVVLNKGPSPPKLIGNKLFLLFRVFRI